jgi:hypothetical protein
VKVKDYISLFIEQELVARLFSVTSVTSVLLTLNFFAPREDFFLLVTLGRFGCGQRPR